MCAAERLPLHCTQILFLIYCQYYECIFHAAVNIVMNLIKRISERRPTNRGKHVFCRSKLASTICPIKCLKGLLMEKTWVFKRNLSSIFAEDRRDVEGGFGLSRSDVLKSITGQEGRLEGVRTGVRGRQGSYSVFRKRTSYSVLKKTGVHLPF